MTKNSITILDNMFIVPYRINSIPFWSTYCIDQGNYLEHLVREKMYNKLIRGCRFQYDDDVQHENHAQTPRDHHKIAQCGSPRLVSLDFMIAKEVVSFPPTRRPSFKHVTFDFLHLGFSVDKWILSVMNSVRATKVIIQMKQLER